MICVLRQISELTPYYSQILLYAFYSCIYGFISTAHRTGTGGHTRAHGASSDSYVSFARPALTTVETASPPPKEIYN